MIKINLLPSEMESAPTKINPAIPVSASVLVPAVLLLFPYVAQISTRKRLQAEAASLTSELERYKPILAQVEALEAAKTQLTTRKGVIQTLEDERLRYPQFFDDFVKLIPNNVWLANLTTTEKVGTKALNVNMDVMALDNYAIADLISNLETSQIFTEVDMGAIAVSQTPTGTTMTFRITTQYNKAEPTPNANQKS